MCIVGATTFWFFNALNKSYTTTINYPINVQFDEDQKEKYTKIMGEGIFRFSVGIENGDDVIHDLSQALEAIKA